MDSPEYKALNELSPILVTCIGQSPDDIFVQLRPSGILAPKDISFLQNSRNSDFEKASRIVDVALVQVQNDIRVYYTLITAMKVSGTWTETVTSKMQEKIRSHHSDSTELSGVCVYGTGNASPLATCSESTVIESYTCTSHPERAFACPYCCANNYNEKLPESAKESLKRKDHFPYLDISGMNEDDLINLKERLTLETKAIKLQFARLTCNVMKDLEIISLDSVKISLLSLQGFTDNIGVKILDEKDAEEIRVAENLVGIYFVIRKYISFFNYHIIEHIVEQHNLPSTDHLEQYLVKFHVFCKRSIFEVLIDVFPSILRNTAKVCAFKCTEGVSTMEGSKQIIGKIAKNFSLRPAALQLCTIKRGCVELQFLLSVAIADRIFPVSPCQLSALSEIGVKVLFCKKIKQICGEETEIQNMKADGVLSSLNNTDQQLKTLVPVLRKYYRRDRVYPRQSIEHKLNNLYLVPGQDGFYFQDRDYYLNDVDTLGSGGFGTCMFGRDHTTEQSFAMKRNKVCEESIIDTMRTECYILSLLKPHGNIISFVGAVIDEKADNILLPRVYKMFMELADYGNLSEMLVTDAEANVKEPLPLDQSLYYIEQILQGVHFLHQNSVLHLDIKSRSVLVFSGGRTVKLAGFGTAVQLPVVGDKIKGCTLYFAAPEVVREETPVFSSDIWSVMCVLVELLTANWPGCHKTTRSHQQMISLVGQYEDCNIEQLIPFSEFEEIDEEIQQLIRCVFTADQTKRPSALTLLNHPRLRDAPEYVSVFDDYDEEMSTEVSYDMMQQGQASLGQAPSISGLPPSQVPLASHVPFVGVPYTASLTAQYQTPFISGPPSLHVHTSLQSSPYPSMDSDRDHPSSSFQSNSHDSEERLSSLTTRGYPLRCVTGCGSGGPDYKTLDSGVKTAMDSSTRSKFWSSEFPTQSIENHDDYHSFPFTESFHNRNRNEFERSASITGLPTANSHSHFMPVSQPRKLVPSTHRLYHSYSAPVVGDHPRKLSLQMNREKVERPRLRRTSSMVYVDKGPEIDSPDREKRASIEELISDVSGLNLDACSPSHSKDLAKGPAAESDTHNTDTVVRHYGRGQDATAQKSVTVYETIC